MDQLDKDMVRIGLVADIPDETPREAAITTGDDCTDEAMMAGKHPAPPPLNYDAKAPFSTEYEYTEETAGYDY